ncbi:MAG: 6-phosphofructokinase [Spirochaetales bacterium]|nr:6-phosphofructokinase [Spirochaetales bacterium]
MRIGVLTAGGDCPGINAAIRGVGKSAILEHGMRVFGFSSGFLGLIESDYRELVEDDLSGILTLGGTILGASREKPFESSGITEYIRSKPEQIKQTYRDLRLDALVCIGGNGTMKTACKLADEGLGIIGLPKTIDNDVWGTDQTFGFDSAVGIAAEAIDRIHTTANSHRRIMVVEVMGHHAGWLALYSGVAGGGDMILIPEIKYNEEVIEEYLKRRTAAGKPYTIIIVAEGVKIPKLKSSAGRYVARLAAKATGLEARETILGYIQRGGSPSPMDRILATRLGAYAAELISKKQFGQMAALKNGSIEAIPLKEVAGKIKLVPVDHSLIARARSIDTNFGDKV